MWQDPNRTTCTHHMRTRLDASARSDRKKLGVGDSRAGRRLRVLRETRGWLPRRPSCQCASSGLSPRDSRTFHKLNHAQQRHVDTVTSRVHVRIIFFTPCNPNKEDRSQEYIDNSRGVVSPCVYRVISGSHCNRQRCVSFLFLRMSKTCSDRLCDVNEFLIMDADHTCISVT